MYREHISGHMNDKGSLNCSEIRSGNGSFVTSGSECQTTSLFYRWFLAGRFEPDVFPARHWLNTPGNGLLTLDLNNAFTSANRSVVMEVCPRLLPHATPTLPAMYAVAPESFVSGSHWMSLGGEEFKKIPLVPVCLQTPCTWFFLR